MKIFLATDHAGFGLKEEMKAHLEANGFEVVDCGAEEYNEGDDYPEFISKAAGEISSAFQSGAITEEVRAIIFGGSGQGEAIVANRFPHVRAAVFYGGDEEGEVVILSRRHNDANVLSLGARFVTPEEAKRIIDIWLQEPFSGEERHERRIRAIEKVGSYLNKNHS